MRDRGDGGAGGRARPTWWQVVVVGAVGGAAIGFVVAMTGRILRDGTGTGDPFDYFRAIGSGLSSASTWQVVGWSALAGAVLTGVIDGIVRVRGRRR